LFKFGFDLQSQFLFAVFMVGSVGSRNRRVFLAKFRVSCVCKILALSWALSIFGKVRFSKIIVLVCLCFGFQLPAFCKSAFFGHWSKAKFVVKSGHVGGVVFF
jgi:hypothetical protein